MVVSQEGIRAHTSKEALLREVSLSLLISCHSPAICPFPQGAAELPRAHCLMALWLEQGPTEA